MKRKRIDKDANPEGIMAARTALLIAEYLKRQGVETTPTQHVIIGTMILGPMRRHREQCLSHLPKLLQKEVRREIAPFLERKVSPEVAVVEKILTGRLADGRS